MPQLLAFMWSQPISPVGGLLVSTLIAAIPLMIVLVLMGGIRKSGLFSSLCGLGAAFLLAILVWRMPAHMAVGSVGFGAVYGLWPIMWIVFTALWLYNVTVETGKFELLRTWLEQQVSTDPCVQVVLIAFCFGALLEGTTGFGAPVAIVAFLLVGLGYDAHRAVKVSLIANTAPVAFGSLGTPIIALAGVTGLDLSKLSAMEGRQLPILSFILPTYLVFVTAGAKGYKRAWPVALVAGASFGSVQALVSNLWGPYTADVLAALAAIAATVAFMHIWEPEAEIAVAGPPKGASQAVVKDLAKQITFGETVMAWLPWVLLSAVVIAWSFAKMPVKGQQLFHIPGLDNQIWITLYGRAYAAIYTWQPLAPGTAVLTAMLIVSIALGASPGMVARCGLKTLKQVRVPVATTATIVGMAYLYNYSGMAYTLGAAVAQTGHVFPLLSSYLGWVACFLSGSDTSSNVLFGNLQVVAAHQLHLNPILFAVTNSSGAVTGKMISPQNIAVGVTTVGLIAQEGKILRSTVWHSIIMAGMISAMCVIQAYWLTGMVPKP
jgi:L-lactate transport